MATGPVHRRAGSSSDVVEPRKMLQWKLKIRPNGYRVECEVRPERGEYKPSCKAAPSAEPDREEADGVEHNEGHRCEDDVGPVDDSLAATRANRSEEETSQGNDSSEQRGRNRPYSLHTGEEWIRGTKSSRARCGRLGATFQESASCCEGLVIFQVPHASGIKTPGRHREVREGLSEAPIWVCAAQFCEGREQFRSCVFRTHSRSFTVGNPATATGSVPVTSTGTNVPGRYFATRVARVTPSLITNSPSMPRLTSSGGIPATDLPCRANWRCSFIGSTPSRRPPGRWRVAGSTCKNSRSLIKSV